MLGTLYDVGTTIGMSFGFTWQEDLPGGNQRAKYLARQETCLCRDGGQPVALKVNGTCDSCWVNDCSRDRISRASWVLMDSCDNPPPPSTAGGWGDPHLYTWDGHLYDFQRVGEFVLLSDDEGHVVQARLAPFQGSTRVSGIVSVAANVDGDRVEVDAGGSTGPILWVNGASSAPSTLPFGGEVRATYDGAGRTAIIEWADGTLLQANDKGSYLDVKVSLRAGGVVAGLLGSADGVPENDLALRDGTSLPLYLDETLSQEYTDSWRISTGESLFRYGPGEDTSTYTDLEFPYAPGNAASLDHDRYAAAKAICQEAGITDEALLEACIVDVGMTGDESLAAGTAEIPPPVSAGPSVYELFLNGEVVDADLVSDEEPIPDGATDGVFDVSVRGPFTALILVTADRYGAPSAGQQWDTLVGDQPIPENLGGSYAVGSETRVLGVEADGVLLNQPDGTILPLSADVHTLRLYATDTGFFTEDQRFRLYGVTSDGLAVPGPITDGSDPEGDLGQFCTAGLSCNAGLTCMPDRNACWTGYGLASDTCCVPSESVGGEGEPCGAGGACSAGFACIADSESCAFGFGVSADTCCIPADARLAVQDDGYTSSGPWQGWAWTAVETPSLGSTVTPSDFEAIVAGDPLCISGTVAPDPDYGSYALLGLNVNQRIDGGDGSELTWSPAGFSGIRYAMSNRGGAPLRLWLRGAADYPDEAWCVDLGANSSHGFIPWGEFETACWDGSGSPYLGDVPIETVMVEVPGRTSEELPYDFCIEDIAPVRTPGASCAGPGGYCWWTYAEASSSAQWVDPLDADTAHVYAAAAPFESAGMGFNLDPDRGLVDLSVSDEFVFDAVVVEGQPFTVTVGNDDAACWWNLLGAGASRYVLDLSSPSACSPTACGYDLRAQWVTFNAPWGSETGQSAEILVSHVELLTVGDGAGQAVAGGAGRGPGGRCWSTFVYEEAATAEWAELDATTAHVHTTAVGDGQSGMKAELLPEERDLSPYPWLELDAEITGADSFEFLTVADGSWCSWYLSAAGAATYRVDLTAPDNCSGKDPAAIRALTEVGQLEFKNLGEPELDLSVTDIRFATVTMAQENGYVTSGPWAGYAWTTVESPSLGSSITPADFGAAPAGAPLCVSGTIAADADWGTYAILGLNINQSIEGGAGSALTWSPVGYTGIQYLVNNPGASPLRLQISGAAGSPDQTWCADLDPETRLGFVAWSEFRTNCWDDSGTPYAGDVPIQSVMMIVHGDDSEPVPFDFCLADLAPVGGGAAAEPEPEVITSADGAWWQEGTVTKGTGNATITINPAATYQTWIGFGGAFNERGWEAMQGLSAADRDLAIRLLFSKTEGAGFSLGRIPMGASDYAVERYCYDDTANDYTMANFSIAQDRQLLIPYIKAALEVEPDLWLWASPWTPPPWMKSNNAYDKGWMKSDAQTLEAYALYFSKFITAYAGENLTVRAVCPHNEPGWEQGYPSCLWDVDTYVNFVGSHLGPQLAADHPDVLIWLGTMSRGSAGTSSDNRAIPGDPAIVTGVMNDATARGYIDGIGLQWEVMTRDYRSYNLPLHATEHKGGNYPWNPSGYPPYNSERAPNDFAYGVESWGYIKDWIVTRNGNSYSAWNMVLDPIGLGNDTERDWRQNALLVVDGTLLIRTPAYYVFRHSSQFVDPNAVRVQTIAAHLRGYLVAAPRGERLRRASRARRPQPREGDRAPLLVDGAADMAAVATIASALQYGVCDDEGGAARA